MLERLFNVTTFYVKHCDRQLQTAFKNIVQTLTSVHPHNILHIHSLIKRQAQQAVFRVTEAISDLPLSAARQSNKEKLHTHAQQRVICTLE